MRKYVVLGVLLSFIMCTGCALNDYRDYNTGVAESSDEEYLVEASEESFSETENKEESEVEETSSTLIESSTNSASADSFDTLVAENPLDAEYAKETEVAENLNEGILINEKYAGMWLEEVENAYSILMEEAPEDIKTSVLESQQKWESELDETIESIQEEANATGGSIGPLAASANILFHYRARAIELYRLIYDYEGVIPFYYLK